MFVSEHRGVELKSFAYGSHLSLHTTHRAINPSARHKQHAVISYVFVTKGTHETTTNEIRVKVGTHFTKGNLVTETSAV